jgi:uncharacterized membrane protein
MEETCKKKDVYNDEENPIYGDDVVHVHKFSNKNCYNLYGYFVIITFILIIIFLFIYALKKIEI